MKLLFWRRKPKPELAAPAAASATPIIERSQIPTRPLAVPIELRDALLRFALDCLVAAGARVRVEADDLISAALPDGASMRYTTSLARARADNGVELLVQGGASLAKLLDECAAHAAVTSLRLPSHADALELARSQLATPVHGCGACAHDARADLCQRCPLHASRIVLSGLPEHATPRHAKEWIGSSVELTYVVVASDRHGRRDDEVRVAFDTASGTALPLLAPATLTDAQASALPGDAAKMLDSAFALAERALASQLHATGALLRLMSEHDYHARLDDIRTTSQRLERESPDEAGVIHMALERELERLGEIFAVDVDARLASVCFVERPMASLVISSQSGAPIELEADLASGVLLPPPCAVCGTETRIASACVNGHLICPACQHNEAASTSLACPICATTASGQAPANGGNTKMLMSRQSLTLAPDQSAVRSLTASLPGAENSLALTLAHLDAMSAATWRLFVEWLMEQDGFRIERRGASGLLEFWLCQSNSTSESLLAGALRYAHRRTISAEDIERLSAQRAATSAVSSLLISTACATGSAQVAAQRLDVRLLDRAELAGRLRALVSTHLHARNAALADQQVRAEAAGATQAALLAVLHVVEEALASTENSRRASGRSAVVAAATTLTDALASASRANLAWDTLIHDWTSAFDEREARDGSLQIRATATTFGEMAERAHHLGAALTVPLVTIGETPGLGDLGYTVWRRDVLEQLSAQYEAFRWRLLAIDPSQWQSFTAAHDGLAGERASHAEATAAHAATRASRAYTELARRARLEASSA